MWTSTTCQYWDMWTSTTCQYWDMWTSYNLSILGHVDFHRSFTLLHESIKDPLLQAKFKFVEFIAEKLNKFLRGFQTEQPTVPFLCETLKELLLSLMNMFILNQTMLKADTLIKVLNIDTTDILLHRSPSNVDIGMAAKLHLREYKQKPNYIECTVTKFQKEVCQFLIGLTVHMTQKCPLNYVIVRCASSLNPNVIAVRDTYELYVSLFKTCFPIGCS